MECPSCASTNVARLEMIWAQGTGSLQATTLGVGTGGLGVGLSGGETQSQLAAAAAPPARGHTTFGVGLALAGLLVGGLALALVAVADFTPVTWVVLVLCALAVALGVWSAVRVARFNRRVWPQRYQAWHATWQCLACGRRCTPTP